MLEKGQLAPDFTLPDQDGRERSLTELLAGEALILYFYPADFTPGCTKEACDLRDLHTQILAAGLHVVGVSPQSPESHRRFRDKNSLPFTLLSDEKKQVIGQYGVDGPLGIGVRRATFLVDSSRKILDSVLADLRVARHREFVEAAIAAR
jgi:peroxiredoxin Q/BCP